MSNHDLPDELRETAHCLRPERSELDVHGLDRVHGRVVGRALRAARHSRHSLAIILCLAVGLVFSSVAPSLAVSGLSSDGSAACAQYPSRCDDPDRKRNSSDELPFTGGAALLILGLGVVFLVSGAVVRSRARGADDD